MRQPFRREQRIAIRIAIALAIVIVAVAAPLILLPGLRLDLAQRLNLVPGRDAEHLYSGDAPVELVVLTRETPVHLSLPIVRYTATYVAERTGTAVLLHDLTRPRSIPLPLPTYDLIAASKDRRAVLFVEHDNPASPRAVLVDVASGQVRPLPPGQTDPGIPGDWTADLASAGEIGCDGVSPKQTWVACIRHGKGNARLLAGDWELDIAPYGGGSTKKLYRGRGSDPIVGWAADETALYFQNESGLWRVAVR